MKFSHNKWRMEIRTFFSLRSFVPLQWTCSICTRRRSTRGDEDAASSNYLKSKKQQQQRPKKHESVDVGGSAGLMVPQNQVRRHSTGAVKPGAVGQDESGGPEANSQPQASPQQRRTPQQAKGAFTDPQRAFVHTHSESQLTHMVNKGRGGAGRGRGGAIAAGRGRGSVEANANEPNSLSAPVNSRGRRGSSPMINVAGLVQQPQQGEAAAASVDERRDWQNNVRGRGGQQQCT